MGQWSVCVRTGDPGNLMSTTVPPHPISMSHSGCSPSTGADCPESTQTSTCFEYRKEAMAF